MLEKYQKTQENTVKTLKNQLKTQKMHHAYIFSNPNINQSKEFVKEFIKEILADENANHKITKEIFVDLKIIKPDGVFIKKEQIADLQKEFKTKPLEGDYKFYIICNVDRLNSSAANTLLKFLEDPFDKVMAFLLTDNLEGVMVTIKSRCQVYHLNDFQIAKKDDKITEIALNFIEKFEKNPKLTYIQAEELLFSQIKERQELREIFDIWIDFYQKKLKNNQKTAEIVKKITILMQLKQLIDKNVNQKLILDKMFWHFKEENNG